MNPKLQTQRADPAPGAEAVRHVGRARLASGFFAVQLVSIFAADAILGPRGLGWFRGPSGAGGVGGAFGLIWAYLVWLRLARGRPWPRALVSALPLALAVVGLSVVIMHLVQE